METTVIVERLQQLLHASVRHYDVEMLMHQPFLSGNAWWATLIPIDICLGTPSATNLVIPSEHFQPGLTLLQREGLIGDIICSDGESHDDDDVLYIPITEKGLCWLGISINSHD